LELSTHQAIKIGDLHRCLLQDDQPTELCSLQVVAVGRRLKERLVWTSTGKTQHRAEQQPLFPRSALPVLDQDHLASQIPNQSLKHPGLLPSTLQQRRQCNKL